MYHGANSFAKENYRETTHAGFGCFSSVPDNRGASEYGRWLSHAARDQLPHPRLPPVAVAGEEHKLKKSNFRAIVLCNAFTELAQGAIAFPVGRAACASRCAGGYSLQAPLVPGIPVLFRLCTLRNC